MTDKLIEAVARAICEADKPAFEKKPRWDKIGIVLQAQFRGLAKAAIAALASAKAEPVAWMYDYGHSRIVKENRDPGMTGYTETPLYAVPPRTAEDERADVVAWAFENGWWTIAARLTEGDHVGAAQ